MLTVNGKAAIALIVFLTRLDGLYFGAPVQAAFSKLQFSSRLTTSTKNL